MVQILIQNFPLPPSANALYKNIGSRRAKSKDYTDYERLVKLWLLRNGLLVERLREQLKQKRPETVFFVERYYYFKHGKILTHDNRPRKNDTSNRIKAADDCIAQILNIDDSIFWDGSFFKRVSEGPYETVTIKLTEIQIPLPEIYRIHA